MSHAADPAGRPDVLSDERAANLAENPFAGQGPVLLDIGGDIGAIILRMPATMEGLEIEISPSGHGGAQGGHHDHEHSPEHHHHAGHGDAGHGDAGHDHAGHDHGDHEHPAGAPHRPHVAVVPRSVNGVRAHSAVFPDLPSGRYELNERGRPVSLHLDVVGGSVTEAAWPEAVPPEA